MNKTELQDKVNGLQEEMNQRGLQLMQNDPIWANKAGTQAAYAEMLKELEGEVPEPTSAEDE
jgi:hypothetical protein